MQTGFVAGECKIGWELLGQMTILTFHLLFKFKYFSIGSQVWVLERCLQGSLPPTHYINTILSRPTRCRHEVDDFAKSEVGKSNKPGSVAIRSNKTNRALCPVTPAQMKPEKALGCQEAPTLPDVHRWYVNLITVPDCQNLGSRGMF